MYKKIIDLVVQEVIPQKIVDEAEYRLKHLQIFYIQGKPPAQYKCSKCISNEYPTPTKLISWLRCMDCDATLPFRSVSPLYENEVKGFFYKKNLNTLDKEELIALYYMIVGRSYRYTMRDSTRYLIEDKDFIQYLLPKCKELVLLIM